MQCDISKYFASIDHTVLKRLLRRLIVDQRLLGLLDQIIASHEDAPGKGMPIGNLTSQLFANIYMHELDIYVKNELHQRQYVRYMDDFAVVVATKAEAWEVLGHIQTFLADELKLRLHPNKIIVRPGRVGITFLGFRLLPTHRRVRTDSLRRHVRKRRILVRGVQNGRITPERLEATVRSWEAHAAYASTWRLRQKLRSRDQRDLTQ